MDLSSLLDEREVMRGLATFARVVDAKDWARLPEVFAADVVFDYGSGQDVQGIEALKATLTQFLDICGGTQHLIGSIMVDVDGDQAVSRAYVQARHQAVSASGGPAFDTNGEYVDRWQRRPEGWRLVRREARWSNLVGDPTVIAMPAADPDGSPASESTAASAV